MSHFNKETAEIYELVTEIYRLGCEDRYLFEALCASAETRQDPAKVLKHLENIARIDKLLAKLQYTLDHTPPYQETPKSEYFKKQTQKKKD